MSTVWDVERALEVLHPLAREVTGRELRADDAATIADHVVTLIETGEPPECDGCAEHARWADEHACECDGNCTSGDRLEAGLWVLEDWPAELAPEMRERMRAALLGETS